jgi:hypothetical protein
VIDDPNHKTGDAGNNGNHAADPIHPKDGALPPTTPPSPPSEPAGPPPLAPPAPDAPPQLLPPSVNPPSPPAPKDPPAPSSVHLDPAPPKPGHEISIPALPAAPPPPSPAPAAGVIATTPPGTARPPNPPASASPVVDSWDERTYVWKKDDTFAAVSKRKYNSEDYALALEMYNRNHPRASVSLRRDGRVGEGDKIYIPEDPRVLEKRHADLFAKPKPASTGASDPAAIQAQFQNVPPPAAPRQ